MLIHCESCGARFRIDASGIELPKFKIKCPKCADAIVVENPPEVHVPVTLEMDEASAAAQAAPQTQASAAAAASEPPAEANPSAAAPEPPVVASQPPAPAASASEPQSEPAPEAAASAEVAPAVQESVTPPPVATDAPPPVTSGAPPPVATGAPPPPPEQSGDSDAPGARVRKRSHDGERAEDLVGQMREELADRYHHLKDCDYFELLSVDPDTPVEQVKSSYFALAKKFHPDRFTAHFDEEEMQKLREIASRLNLAFSELRDPDRREQYRLKVMEPDRFEKQQAANRVMEAMMQYEKGKVLFNKNGFAEALECFEWAVELHPSEAEYHHMLGQTAMRHPESGRTMEVIGESLKKAVELDENNTKYHMALGRYWKQRQEIKRAMMCFKRVRDIDSSHHEAKREIRLYLKRRNEEAEAKTAVGKIKKLFR